MRGRTRYTTAGRAALLCAAALAMAGAGPRPAMAKGWPQPAAGPSRSGDPEVIFTFDDGPQQRWSGKILDTLAAHHVHAVFYWVGRRLGGVSPASHRRRALLARALAEGHLIGNHTVHHAHLCGTPPAEAAKEIDDNHNLLEKLSGFPVVLFRVPYGDHCKQLLAMMAKRGLHHTHWDIDPQEWVGKDGATTAAYIIAHLKHLKGRAVVLMHDTHPATARALPIILDWIEAENRRRAHTGQRPIRILSGTDLVMAQDDSPLLDWSGTEAVAAGSWLGRQLDHLVPGTVVPHQLSRR